MPIPTIILDTNILVAALRSRDGASFKLVSLVGTGLFNVALTVPLVFEYEDVLAREHLGISPARAEAALDYLCSVSSKHSVYFMWRPHLRDAKDDLVLEAAVTSDSSHIITFNTKDFANIGSFGIQAVWPGNFLKQLGE